MFALGFEKTAKEKKDNHMVRRFFIGNPASAALAAKKGKGEEAFAEAAGHVRKKQIEGLLQYGKKGLIGGAALGAGFAGHALHKGRGGKEALRRAGIGLLGGGLVGAHVGGTVGSFKGHLGEEATKIHNKHAK